MFANENSFNVKNLSKQIMGFILIVAFLWATTGITVYSHYCFESDSINKSLLVDNADCEHHDEDMQMQSCCAEKKSCHIDDKKADCCATQKQVFKLSSVFNVPGENQKVKVLDFILYKHFVLNEEIENDFGKDYFHKANRPPPNIYGKRLILAMHQQKIAPAPIV